MRLSDYILERVATRTIPEVVSTREPSVLMKMDIEGSELEVIMDLILTGALQVQGSFSRLY
jgi:FkbM family methyltransferase